MTDAAGPGRPRQSLRAAVRAHARSGEVWQQAELHLLQRALRERLALLGVEPTEDVAVAIMGAALVLAEHVPEWGGDARDALGELAGIALGLLEGEPAERSGP